MTKDFDLNNPDKIIDAAHELYRNDPAFYHTVQMTLRILGDNLSDMEYAVAKRAAAVTLYVNNMIPVADRAYHNCTRPNVSCLKCEPIGHGYPDTGGLDGDYMFCQKCIVHWPCPTAKKYIADSQQICTTCWFGETPKVSSLTCTCCQSGHHGGHIDYNDKYPCLPSLGEHCGKCHRCTNPVNKYV